MSAVPSCSPSTHAAPSPSYRARGAEARHATHEDLVALDNNDTLAGHDGCGCERARAVCESRGRLSERTRDERDEQGDRLAAVVE